MLGLRIDDVELVGAEFLADQRRLVLEGDQHVALVALGECGGGAAAAAVEHRHVGEQLADELLGAGLVASLA